MAAARNMIPSSSTRNLLFSSFRDCHRRLFSSSSSKSNPPNWPPPVRESYLTFEKQPVDIGRWIFRIKMDAMDSEIQRFSEKDLYKFIVKAVGESIGSEAEAQKRIYFVATPRMGVLGKVDFGFGGYFDIETAYKIVKDVEWIFNSSQDIFYEVRENHPATRQLSLQ